MRMLTGPQANQQHQTALHGLNDLLEIGKLWWFAGASAFQVNSGLMQLFDPVSSLHQHGRAAGASRSFQHCVIASDASLRQPAPEGSS